MNNLLRLTRPNNIVRVGMILYYYGDPKDKREVVLIENNQILCIEKLIIGDCKHYWTMPVQIKSFLQTYSLEPYGRRLINLGYNIEL